MRSKNELIDIVIDEIQSNSDNPYPGICSALSRCYFTTDEHYEMTYLIMANRPESAIGKNYFFPRYEIAPRIEFINSLKDPS